MIPDKTVLESLRKLLNELLDGSAKDAAWVLNPGDRGLLFALDQLSAHEASAIPSSGGASVAAHADHLRYGFELMNRWTHGEQPFADADYSASWTRSAVDEAEWASRRASLRKEAYAWREAIERIRDWSEVELAGVVGSVVHLGYHLGAIRQMNRSLRGPAAVD